MRRARVTTISPSSVRRPVDRSISEAFNSASRRAIWAETLDWVVDKARAAPENEPYSEMATSTCNCFNSMGSPPALWGNPDIAKNDSNYRVVRLECSRIHVHNFTYINRAGNAPHWPAERTQRDSPPTIGFR